MDTILSIKQITDRLRNTIEARFPYVRVQGEVTNLSRPSSGHIYFALKEGDNILNCVWFKGKQQAEMFDSLTGEVWEDGPHECIAPQISNGQSLFCAGQISVYGAKGQYQLSVDVAQMFGVGFWQQQFELLKRRLDQEGIFDQSHKRPIPKNPRQVAVITSPTGAAIRDFIRISSERGTGAKIRIYPALIQGDNAPLSILSALKRAENDAWADVIVIIRGGGSIQDLWAFNDERIARAVYACHIPILTGIGHEIDHSITDFAADFSAATPSHTAQILWEKRENFALALQHVTTNLKRAAQKKIQLAELELGRIRHTISLLSPEAKVAVKEQLLETKIRLLHTAFSLTLDRYTQKINASTNSLNSIFQNLAQKEYMVDSLNHRLLNTLPFAIAKTELSFKALCNSFLYCGRNIIPRHENTLEILRAKLAANDPLTPLQRGYAIVLSNQKNVLKSLNQIHEGETVNIRLSDGTVSAVITTKSPFSE